MREQKQIEFGAVEQVQDQAELDLVVPFTTPRLTRVALDAANRMGAGLNATLRIVKVQVVPYPLDLRQSPVYIDFLKEQLSQFQSALPLASEIRLARELGPGLTAALGRESVVVLATPKRLWRSRSERLAARLRRAGHKVVLVTEEAKNA